MSLDNYNRGTTVSLAVVRADTANYTGDERHGRVSKPRVLRKSRAEDLRDRVLQRDRYGYAGDVRFT